MDGIDSNSPLAASCSDNLAASAEPRAANPGDLSLQNKKAKGRRSVSLLPDVRSNYLVSAVSSCFLRLSQLYLRWNFSTRPVVSTNFILPVKKGWHTEQISTLMFFLVLRVTNLFPQPQVTVVSSYFG